MMICILPDWDNALIKEMTAINNNKFYLSMTQLSPTSPIKAVYNIFSLIAEILIKISMKNYLEV